MSESESFLSKEKGVYYRATEIEHLKIGDHIFCVRFIKGVITSCHGIMTGIEKVIYLDKKYKEVDELTFEAEFDFLPRLYNERSIHYFLDGCSYFYVVKYNNDTLKKTEQVVKTPGLKPHYIRDLHNMSFCLFQ